MNAERSRPAVAATVCAVVVVALLSGPTGACSNTDSDVPLNAMPDVSALDVDVSALDASALEVGDAPATDAGHRDSGVQPQPIIVSSVPAHGALDVYPSPFGDGRNFRFELTVRFSARMDVTLSALPFGPQNELAEERSIVWSEHGDELTLHVPPPPLAPQILRENTTYELALSTLRGANGTRLALGADQRTLSFTTGKYDGLLNHSCGHTEFGPFGSGAAAALPFAADSGAPGFVVNATHTQFNIALPAAGDEYEGVIGLALSPPGAYRLYFDRDVDVTRLQSSVELAMPAEASPNSCPGIRTQVDFELESSDVSTGHPLLFQLRASVDSINLIAESIAEFAAMSESSDR
jgi:hypothetical protein